MLTPEEKESARLRIRASPWLRAGNIAIRTAHIAAFGALFGGHVFGIAAEQLTPWLYASLSTGLLLGLVEAIPDWRWLGQGSGVLSLVKVMLLALLPWFWAYCVPILASVIVIGSVGSHMPRRFRHYPLLGGRSKTPAEKRADRVFTRR